MAPWNLPAAAWASTFARTAEASFVSLNRPTAMSAGLGARFTSRRVMRCGRPIRRSAPARARLFHARSSTRQVTLVAGPALDPADVESAGSHQEVQVAIEAGGARWKGLPEERPTRYRRRDSPELNALSQARSCRSAGLWAACVNGGTAVSAAWRGVALMAAAGETRRNGEQQGENALRCVIRD